MKVKLLRNNHPSPTQEQEQESQLWPKVRDSESALLCQHKTSLTICYTCIIYVSFTVLSYCFETITHLPHKSRSRKVSYGQRSEIPSRHFCASIKLRSQLAIPVSFTYHLRYFLRNADSRSCVHGEMHFVNVKLLGNNHPHKKA